jgi:hypothetical protein
MLIDRIPFLRHKKLETEGVPRKARTSHQFVNDEDQHANNRHAAGGHRDFEHAIGSSTVGGVQK